MKVVNLSESNSVLKHYIAELRDVNVQKDSMRFRRNVERIGEIMAYEISKTLSYTPGEVQTPLGVAQTSLIADKIILGTILRAGLPLHNGFLNYFDKAENAFVSAYRKYHNATDFDIYVEYLASPPLDGKTLILTDPMLATGRSLELAYRAMLVKGNPQTLHVAAVIASKPALDYLQDKLRDSCTVWVAALDEEINDHAYIVPGLGDAGDLCYGEK